MMRTLQPVILQVLTVAKACTALLILMIGLRFRLKQESLLIGSGTLPAWATVT